MQMSLVDLIKRAESMSILGAHGKGRPLQLLPALTETEIAAFAKSLPCPLPADVRELLRYCRGIVSGLPYDLDFTGQGMLFGFEIVFPHGVPIAADGFGSFWVVDLTDQSIDFGPIYFTCHDAPVVLYQCDDLEEFLTELFRGHSPTRPCLLGQVQQDEVFEVWRKNPGLMSVEECRQSSDSILREFGAELDLSWQVIDMRNASAGFGFSWGRYGPNTELKRHGHYPIFAYNRPPATGLKAFFRSLIGWSPGSAACGDR